MLDNQNFLGQFKVTPAFRELEALFEPELSQNFPDFSAERAVFYSPEPTFVKIGLKFIKKAAFEWRQSDKWQVEIDSEIKELVFSNNSILLPWQEILLVLKIAGVDIHTALKENKALFEKIVPEVATSDNLAKILAKRLAGKSSLLLCSENTVAAGEWWQSVLANYAKNLAFSQSIEDLNYNAWQSHPVEKAFGVIDLRSSFDQQSTTVKFQQKDRFLSGKMPASYQIIPTTSDKNSQFLELMLLGQAVSFYLASLNKQALDLR